MPTAAATTHKVKSFPRTRPRDLPENPREEAASDHEHEYDKYRDLAERKPKRFQQLPIGGAFGKTACIATEPRRQRGQQYQDQDHHEVFDHEPADGDAAVDRVKKAAIFQCPEDYDRARHGESETEHDPCAETPAPKGRDHHTEGGRNRHLGNCSRQCDPANRQ